MTDDISTRIALFKGKKIRRVLYQGEWWFSVVDVIEALTDSSQPSKYWTAMKARVSDEGGFQLSTICRQLKLESSDGKSMRPIVLIRKVFFVSFSRSHP